MRKAIDKVTIEVDYPRPHFDFPDLASPEGNPWVYWYMARKAIRPAGYTVEAEQMRDLKNTRYEEHFDYLARLLDFTPKEEKIKEDDDYVYLRVKKDTSREVMDLKQPMLFKLNKPDLLAELLEQGEDFSIRNCYGRHILHYANNPETIRWILAENKKHEWFDIFELDNFNGTVLHTQTDIRNFAIVLNAMYEENPKLAELYFTGTDFFDNNASGVLLHQLDLIFSQKNPQPVSPEQLEKLSECLLIIQKVNPRMAQDIIASFSDIPAVKKGLISKSEVNFILFNSLLEEKSEGKSKKLKV